MGNADSGDDVVCGAGTELVSGAAHARRDEGDCCEDIDACSDLPFDCGVVPGTASCVDTPAPGVGFTCECDAGYVGGPGYPCNPR